MGLRSLFRGKGRAREEREHAVRLAAAEAAEDDPLFDPAEVTGRAGTLFTSIQGAWSRNDIEALRQWVGRDLMVEWETRLADFARRGWRNQVDVLEGPDTRYVGITNREGDAEDRAVVLLTARLHDRVIDRSGAVLPSEDGEYARVSEFWTLGKRDGAWIVVSIEQEREGAHHLSSPLLASPEGDVGRIRAGAVMEVAGDDAVPAERVGELLSPGFTGNAREAALDLSVVDGRFSPDVLSTAVAEVVEAWAIAIDGPDQPLAARATPDALRSLLYPTGSERARLVIRGLAVDAVTIADVQPGPPPRVELTVEATGIQYVEDRDTTEVLAGSKRRRRTTKQRWTLELSDEDAAQPWLVVAADTTV